MSAVLNFPAKPQRQRAAPTKVSLTENRVEALKPDGDLVVFDTKVMGLAVRVRASGSKSYIWTRKVRGRPVRLLLGKVPGLRLDDARKAAERLNGQVAAGEDPRAERALAKAAAAVKSVTLADAYTAFLDGKERRASTVLDYRTVWRLHVPASMKTKALADVAPQDIEVAKARLIKAGKARTAGKVVVMLSAIMRVAGRRHDNPADSISKPASKVRTRRLNAGEIRALLRVLDERRGETFADMIAIALLTGARRGALCTMQWGDVDLAGGVWVVPSQWSKNTKELAIALPARAVDILKARRATKGPSPWVWPSTKSETGHITNPEKPLSALLRLAGVSKVSMHDLRRSLGSLLAMGGANASTIQKVLGHVSPQSAKAYLHLDVAAAREAVERALGDD